jgi:hypothetical protein
MGIDFLFLKIENCTGTPVSTLKPDKIMPPKKSKPQKSE